MAEQLFLREGGREFLLAGQDAKGRPQGLVKVICARCGGAGRADKWAFTGFTCYDCGGSGTRGDRHVRLYTAAELEVLNGRREKVRAKGAAKRQAAQQAEQERRTAEAEARIAKNAADPLYAGLKALVAASEAAFHGVPEFLESAWSRIQHADLSEAQRAGVQKFIDAAAERKAKAAIARHIGEIGERIDFTGAVERVHEYEAKPYHSYGGQTVTKEMVTIRTDDGAPLVWFTAYSQLKRGMRVAGKATVKEHKHFRGEPQTTVQRVKVTASNPGI